MKKFLSIVAALPMILVASAALARGYSGSWPLTVGTLQRPGGNYCLTLADDGSLGWKHSGQATIGGETYGTFQVIGGDLVVTIEEQSGQGQNAGLVFILAAANDKLGKGSYDLVYGGEEFDSGALTAGKNGGCAQ